MSTGNATITICHFNDAYTTGNVAQWKRFVSDNYPDALITCGGDVFNPSLASTVTRGKHVPPLLVALGVDVGCIGNHDLDFGIETFTKLSGRTEFPWLCSNMLHGSDPFPGTVKSHIIEKNGVKLAFYGLVGTDFVGTLNFDVSDFTVIDAVECARQMEKELKEAGADHVICMSHCRMSDDVLIATQNTGVSLLLGAHDHAVIAEPPIFKAGSDWENAVVAKLIDGKWECEIVNVPSDYPKDEEIPLILQEWEKMLQKGMGKVLATLAKPLNIKTELIRCAESPVGNWICDLIKYQVSLNCILCSSLEFRCVLLTNDLTLLVCSCFGSTS